MIPPPQEPRPQLLASSRGTGKSTELRRLRRDLIQAGYKVTLIDIEDYLSLDTPEAALADAHQAVAIYRTLAQERPDAFLPDLARSLHTQGAILWTLGLSDDALAAAREAVALYRALAQDHPEAFFPDLAASLSNLAVTLSSVGQHKSALAASSEALNTFITMYQTHSKTDAAALLNLGFDLGSRTIDVVRRVTHDHPSVLPGDLARLLSSHGGSLLDAGRSAEALAHFEEGIEALWPHFERHPEAFGGLMQALLDGALSASAGAPSAALQARRAQLQARSEPG